MGSNVTDLSLFGYVDDIFQGIRHYSIKTYQMWDTSPLVTNMYRMFYGTSSFNQNISNWDVSNVTTMRYMFNLSVFNQDIGGWDVSSVTIWEICLGMQLHSIKPYWDVVTNMLHVTSIDNMFVIMQSLDSFTPQTI